MTLGQLLGHDVIKEENRQPKKQKPMSKQPPMPKESFHLNDKYLQEARGSDNSNGMQFGLENMDDEELEELDFDRMQREFEMQCE